MRYALYLFFFCHSLTATAALDCKASNTAETVKVEYIHDGDTLFLSDKRKVRLIGLNTPELAQNNQAAEPFAQQARNHLRTLIAASQNTLRLQYDVDKKDKYGRILAHLFLPNGRSVAELMLLEGLATTLVVPPNVAFLRCYQASENVARQRQKGIWRLPSYQIKTIDQLPKNAGGFFIVQGRIANIQIRKNSAIIQLSKINHTQLDLFIHADDKKYFISLLNKLSKGDTITARGWIHPRKNNLSMRIRHPSALK